MWKPAKALPVPRQDREVLGALARAPKTPQRLALRARIVLGAADRDVVAATLQRGRSRWVIEGCPSARKKEKDHTQEDRNDCERDVTHQTEERIALEHSDDGACPRR